jgi:hypothetical protein
VSQRVRCPWAKHQICRDANLNWPPTWLHAGLIHSYERTTGCLKYLAFSVSTLRSSGSKRTILSRYGSIVPSFPKASCKEMVCDSAKHRILVVDAMAGTENIASSRFVRAKYRYQWMLAYDFMSSINGDEACLINKISIRHVYRTKV